ncbi:uncharacterized protein CIMG_12594 [Coccidioides immitis RS]|uniref:Uncharacterized protein n=1 Tax=Coccidioides immitis (strain RS) TaxID=246410 RepID=J3K012_COCIM|nr:uncharacterized protein CIMG_12594 [Coccidioides immitis RS]EAS27145.3 hypothetical protein CIMG_12594 [Coccidioides immitis RS]
MQQSRWLRPSPGTECYVEAAPTGSAAAEEYDIIVPFYHKAFQHHAVDIGPFVSFADLCSGRRVLGFGCGAGWVTAQAASRVGQRVKPSPLMPVQFLRHLTNIPVARGLIVSSQDHEHHDLAYIGPLPFDSSDTEELHWHGREMGVSQKSVQDSIWDTLRDHEGQEEKKAEHCHQECFNPCGGHASGSSGQRSS